MKKLVLTVAAFAMIGLPAWAALKVGDQAPDFTAKGRNLPSL
jgi:hypothetical protein